MEDSVADLIEGRNPVWEALHADRPIRKIQIARTARLAGTLARIVSHAKSRGIPVQFVDPRHLAAVSATGAHQGVIALISPHRTVELEALLKQATARGAPFLVLLDGIEDPRNLGAIVRTAEAAGAHGVVIPRRRAAGLSPAVAKASAGAIEHVPVAMVTNMAQAVKACRAAGLLTVAADPRALRCYDEVALRPPLALVIGGERSGVRRLVRERCDLTVRIPMRGRISSLNASVAAAILLFEVVRQHRHGHGGPRERSGQPCEERP
ncbi:MAG: 23S rRNA (guanosine(2251)-2'-O)-methyltransferase RlmB [Armatimonadota bacterium]|nr:23S rRNA (guanosine(2251)-2'-O)-methyltransferase RlmB [Armatimonadota bacterium]MDR5696702.1 23S rRNA (guanosine(2251)-2'-O)-methyltransferase RlmB [Armatimonadota bacterium]